MADNEHEGVDPEVAELRRQGDETTNESLEATRRMRRMAEEAREMGTATNDALQKQGQQLNNVENELDKQNATMREAEGHLTQMEKFCGVCTCPWNKQSSHEGSKSYKKAYADSQGTTTAQPEGTEAMGASSAPAQKAAAPPPAAGPPQEGARMKRITNDAREDEMEENLDHVGNIVGDLRAQALAMNAELNTQNKQLDRVGDKTDSNIERVERGNVRATNILKNA